MFSFFKGKKKKESMIISGKPLVPLSELPKGSENVLKTSGIEVTKIGLNGKLYLRKIIIDQSTCKVSIVGGKHPLEFLCAHLVVYLQAETEELQKYQLNNTPDMTKIMVLKTGQRCYTFLCQRQVTAELMAMTIAVLGNLKNSKGASIKIQQYADGSRYRGEMCDGLRHGKGTLIMADGVTYESMWINDRREGDGIEIHSDGTKFIGTYKNGQRHGKGSMTWFDNSHYEGQFTQGRACGEGTLSRADGSQYVGSFKDDCMHGEGVMTWPDGVQYRGQFRFNKREGYGTMQWIVGKWSMYNGNWKMGMQHGEGSLVSHDGLSYQGVFVEGKLERWLDT